MKKITDIILTLLISVMLTLISINPSFADCDMDAIKRDIEKTVDTTASQLRMSLETYNRATKNFESSCGEITEKYRKEKLAFNIRTLQQALAFNKSKFAYLTDMSQYEDTDIDWGMVPANKQECEDLRIKAWEAQDHYTTLYTKAIVVFGVAGRDANVPVSCVCPEGSAEQQCTAYTSTKIEEQKTGDKCDTFATYLSSLSSCPLCPIFQAVLNTDAKVASIAWRALAKALQSVVMVFFMVYLALETLKIVSNIAGSSMGSYLKSVFILGFKVLMTYFLLDNSSYIYGYFISPVLQAGLDMGTALVSISSSQASICLVNNANVDFVSTPGGVLDAGLLDNIMRTVRCYGHSAAIMPAVGKGLICHGWANDGSLLPDFSMWFSGILFYIFGLAIWLVISFYLIDCTIQLGMLCGIVPFLIACWPFKLTQSYSLKGVGLLMNTFFNYVMLGIVLLLGVEIVDFATGKKSGTLEQFMTAMNNNNLGKLKEVAGLDGVEILILVVCCIFAFKLIANTNALADKFSKGAGMNIASKLGGLAASAAVSSVATGGQIMSSVGKAAWEQTGLQDKFTGAGESVKQGILGAASDFGAKIGLRQYQPQAESFTPSATTTKTNTQTNGNTNNTQNVDNNNQQGGGEHAVTSGGTNTGMKEKDETIKTEQTLVDKNGSATVNTNAQPKTTTEQNNVQTGGNTSTQPLQSAPTATETGGAGSQNTKPEEKTTEQTQQTAPKAESENAQTPKPEQKSAEQSAQTTQTGASEAGNAEKQKKTIDVVQEMKKRTGDVPLNADGNPKYAEYMDKDFVKQHSDQYHYEYDPITKKERIFDNKTNKFVPNRFDTAVANNQLCVLDNETKKMTFLK